MRDLKIPVLHSVCVTKFFTGNTNIDCIALLTLASFCSIIFVFVTSHGHNTTTDLSPPFQRLVREPSVRSGPVGGRGGVRLDRELRTSLKSLSSAYSVIFNSIPVNCIPFIPSAAYQAMLHLNINDFNESLQTTDFIIPDGYLHDCLSSIHYDRQLPAYIFLSPYADNKLTFSMTVNELVGYEFDGKLTLKPESEH